MGSLKVKSFTLALLSTLSLTACAGETQKTSKYPVQAEVAQLAKEEAPSSTATKRLVCIDKITRDGKQVFDKNGKPAKDCREMKIHRKLEGTEVPKK